MTQQRQSRLLLLGLAYLGFISIGLPDGLLGVAWPSIRAYFQLPLDALGPFLVVFTSRYVLSSFGSGRILSHINVGAFRGGTTSRNPLLNPFPIQAGSM